VSDISSGPWISRKSSLLGVRHLVGATRCQTSRPGRGYPGNPVFEGSPRSVKHLVKRLPGTDRQRLASGVEVCKCTPRKGFLTGCVPRRRRCGVLVPGAEPPPRRPGLHGDPKPGGWTRAARLSLRGSPDSSELPARHDRAPPCGGLARAGKSTWDPLLRARLRAAFLCRHPSGGGRVRPRALGVPPWAASS
jgi:hypothetical protein